MLDSLLWLKNELPAAYIHVLQSLTNLELQQVVDHAKGGLISEGTYFHFFLFYKS